MNNYKAQVLIQNYIGRMRTKYFKSKFSPLSMLILWSKHSFWLKAKTLIEELTLTVTVTSAKHSHLPVRKYSFEILQIQKYPVLQFQIPGHWERKDTTDNKNSSKW